MMVVEYRNINAYCNPQKNSRELMHFEGKMIFIGIHSNLPRKTPDKGLLSDVSHLSLLNLN